MNPIRFALLAALGLSALWLMTWTPAADPQEGEAATDPDAAPLADLADDLSETLTTITGIEMPSSRYAAALQNPKNAALVQLLQAAEQRHGIPAGLLLRQAWQESRFNPQAVSPAGAQGLMQFMPATAKEWGVIPFDAASSADGAGRYMQWLYSRLGSWSLALAAYNWGIGNVLKKGMDRAPLETRNYLAQIGDDVSLT